MRKILFVSLIIIFIITLACTQQVKNEEDEKKIIDKIEIYHIHEVPECYSCMISGQYAEEVLNTSFSDELASGKITYKDVDKANPENSEVIKKYDVTEGYSGIYIGVYSNKGFEYKEYTVMSNLDNKEAFMQYFKNYIATLLGG